MIDLIRLMTDDGATRPPIVTSDSRYPDLYLNWAGKKWRGRIVPREQGVGSLLMNCISMYDYGKLPGGRWDCELFIQNPDHAMALWWPRDARRHQPGIIEEPKKGDYDEGIIFYVFEEVL